MSKIQCLTFEIWEHLFDFALDKSYYLLLKLFYFLLHCSNVVIINF